MPVATILSATGPFGRCLSMSTDWKVLGAQDFTDHRDSAGRRPATKPRRSRPQPRRELSTLPHWNRESLPLQGERLPFPFCYAPAISEILIRLPWSADPEPA